jgi:hypothetical protein
MPDFESRNLRVQLPCGSQTIIQCRLGTCLALTCPQGSICRWPSFICPIFTCGWGTCGFSFAQGPVECAASDPGPLVTHVAVEDLADLREMLEEQLKEIKAAEAEVAKRQRKK